MVAADTAYREGREAVIARSAAVRRDATLDEAVPRFTRRRRASKITADVPETRLDAIRRAAAFVAANITLLDAAADGDPDRLDPAAEAIEAETAELDADEALARFETASQALLERVAADPDLAVDHVYPVARTATDVLVYAAAELHLIARMLDPTYEPADPRALMHLLNGALRPMLGQGLEDWVSERIQPWRRMVIQRGLAWR